MSSATNPASADQPRTLRWARGALIGLLLLPLAASSVYAWQEPVANDVQQAPVTDDNTNNSVLELSKLDTIVELLMTSYTADLALKSAVRTAECTRAIPGCAPLFFAEDVILGSSNFVRLLRVLQGLPDPAFTTIFQRRKYRPPSLRPAAALPEEMVSLAEYTLERQVALYERLEAWQVTLERYSAAVGSNDESAIAAQRRALDDFSSEASTAAAALNAASLQFLESLTPLLRPFASAIAVEDADATKTSLQDSALEPEQQERFSDLGIPPADSDALRAEVAALSSDAAVDLLEGLTAVANGYDELADLTTVPAHSAANLRPVANAGPDQKVPTGDADHASVVLDGTGSTDPDAGVLEYRWTGAAIAVSGPKPTIALPAGTHHIALTVADGNGGTDVDLVTISVANAAAPIITGLTATTNAPGPPSRQLVPVELDVKVVDNDDPMPFCQVISVGVNVPGNDTGGATDPDVVFEGNLRLLLRPDQSGARPGRAYNVTVQCTDKSNHSSVSSVLVSVPR